MLNATIVGVDDDDIADVNLTCAEVENCPCLPYIGIIMELIFLSDIYIPHDVDQDADDSKLKCSSGLIGEVQLS